MNQTQICNIALGHIGEARIMDIDEVGTEARTCRRFFDLVRDSLLRSHHWNFAARLATLSRLAEAPAFRYLYAYALPSDYLSALTFNGRIAGNDRSKFEIHGRSIIANDETAQLEYTRIVEDSDDWDPLFVEVFAYKLAASIAPLLTQSNSMAERMEQMAARAYQMGRAADGHETRPRVIQPYEGSQILNARLVGTYGQDCNDWGECASPAAASTPAASSASTASSGAILVAVPATWDAPGGERQYAVDDRYRYDWYPDTQWVRTPHDRF